MFNRIMGRHDSVPHDFVNRSALPARLIWPESRPVGWLSAGQPCSHELAEAAQRLRPSPSVLLVELFATTTVQAQLQGDLAISITQLPPPVDLLTPSPDSFAPPVTRPVANQILLEGDFEHSDALEERMHRSNLVSSQHEESAHGWQA